MERGFDYMTRGMRRRGEPMRSRRCVHCAKWRILIAGAVLVLALLWAIDSFVMQSGIAG